MRYTPQHNKRNVRNFNNNYHLSSVRVKSVHEEYVGLKVVKTIVCVWQYIHFIYN